MDNPRYFLYTRGRRIVAYVAGFILFVVPVFVVMLYHYDRLKSELTREVFVERNTIALLASSSLKQRLDHLSDVAQSLATRTMIRSFLAEGKWKEAIEVVGPIAESLPAVERVFIVDVHGTTMADFPELPGVIGKNFAYRDWYRGVTEAWKPYVSEVYRRTAEPQYNVIALAVPVFEEGERGLAVGILVLQVRVDTLVNWVRDIDAGPGGLVFFVDKNGIAAAHPNLPPDGELVDFSSLLSVQQIKRGQGGVDIFFSSADRVEFLEAYQPVSEYGFGVVFSQPVESAFALRNHVLSQVALFGLLAASVIALLVIGILRVMSLSERYRRRERMVLDNMGDGVVMIDLNWKITYFNSTAEQMTGWKREEVLSKLFRTVMRFIREQDKMENIAPIEEAILFKVVKEMSDHTVLVRKDSKEVAVVYSAAPIIDERGDVVGAIIVFHDAEHERESQMLRSDFAYASHQLRTPVSKALWNMELALSETNMAAIQGEVKTAYLSLKSVRKLSESLLAASRLDQKMVVPHVVPVKLSDVCDQILKDLETKAHDRAFRFNCVDHEVVEKIVLMTDAKLLEHALFEILDNAISYSPPKGEAKLQVVSEKEGVVMTIEDKGIGIPENQHPLVFTRFFRGSNINTTDIAGAGLGLYIAREYIKLLGGNIWFESVEGKGTVVRIFLPMKKLS